MKLKIPTNTTAEEVLKLLTVFFDLIFENINGYTGYFKDGILRKGAIRHDL